MGAQWAGTMWWYESCTPYAWTHFVGAFFVMKFFVANLFVALIVEGFCLTEEEKLARQEKLTMDRMAEESGVLRLMAAGAEEAGSTELVVGAMDFLKNESRGRMMPAALSTHGTKAIPTASDIMKMTSMNARAHKLSGPMAKAKREMGRKINIDKQLEQMKKLKDEAAKQVSDGKKTLKEQADKAARAAAEAADKANKNMMQKMDTMGKELAKGEGETSLPATSPKSGELPKGKGSPRASVKFSADNFTLDRNIDELNEAVDVEWEHKKKQSSWNMFAIENPIRKNCIAATDHHYFDGVVLVFIIVSSISIAAEGPHNADHPEGLRLMYQVINVGTLLIFWLEFFCKTIANGFYSTPSPYIQEPWNQLDFFILLSSTVEYFGASIGAGDTVRVLRTLRVMRPLRMMKHNDSMRVLIDAIQNFMPVMIGVLGMMIIFFTTYAIFGLGLFMGKFYFCNCDDSGRWGGTAHRGPWGLPRNTCTDPDWATLGRDDCLAQVCPVVAFCAVFKLQRVL